MCVCLYPNHDCKSLALIFSHSLNETSDICTPVILSVPIFGNTVLNFFPHKIPPKNMNKKKNSHCFSHCLLTGNSFSWGADVRTGAGSRLCESVCVSFQAHRVWNGHRNAAEVQDVVARPRFSAQKRWGFLLTAGCSKLISENFNTAACSAPRWKIHPPKLMLN